MWLNKIYINCDPLYHELKLKYRYQFFPNMRIDVIAMFCIQMN